MLAYATLLQLQAREHDLLAIVAEWLWMQRPQESVIGAQVWQYPRIEVRTARAGTPDAAVWGLQVNSRDPRIPSRDWRLELTLRDLGQGGARATVAVHALDAEHPCGSSPLFPTHARARLARTRWARSTDAGAAAARDRHRGRCPHPGRAYRAPDRAHSVVAICRGEVALDVPAVRRAGRHGRSCRASAGAASGRWGDSQAGGCSAATGSRHFPPRVGVSLARNPTPTREQRLMLAVEARTLADSVLAFGAPRAGRAYDA